MKYNKYINAFSENIQGNIQPYKKEQFLGFYGSKAK